MQLYTVLCELSEMLLQAVNNNMIQWYFCGMYLIQNGHISHFRETEEVEIVQRANYDVWG